MRPTLICRAAPLGQVAVHFRCDDTATPVTNPFENSCLFSLTPSLLDNTPFPQTYSLHSPLLPCLPLPKKKTPATSTVPGLEQPSWSRATGGLCPSYRNRLVTSCAAPNWSPSCASRRLCPPSSRLLVPTRHQAIGAYSCHVNAPPMVRFVLWQTLRRRRSCFPRCRILCGEMRVSQVATLPAAKPAQRTRATEVAAVPLGALRRIRHSRIPFCGAR